MDKSIEIQELPLEILNKILEKISVRELLHVRSFLRYNFSTRASGAFDLKIKTNECSIEMVDFCRHWIPTNTVEEFVNTFRKFNEVFKGPINRLQIQAEHLKEILDRNILPAACRELELTSGGGETEQEAVDRILNCMKIDYLVFDIEGCHIRHEAVFNLDALEVLSGSWMTPQDLLNCENRLLQIVDCEFTEKDLNDFLMNWIEGKKEKLRSAMFTRGVGRWNIEEVFAGVKTFPYDPTRRDRYYFPSRKVPQTVNEGPSYYRRISELENGVDLEHAPDLRRNDGTWATIECTRKQINFYIWKDDVHPSRFMIRDLHEKLDELENAKSAKNDYLRTTGIGDEEKEAVEKDIQALDDRFNKLRDILVILQDQ